MYQRTRAYFERRYAKRAVFLRNFSVAAAATIAPHSLDFIYLDGRHDIEGVQEDLAAFWPKLCHGGVFAGHDHSDKQVATAVMNFVLKGAARGRVGTLWVTADHPASWFLFRHPKPCR